MYYITLDLEWNQAYQQKALAVQKRLSLRLRGEVIQIGAVKLNEKMQPCGSFSMIVCPKYYKRMLRHVSALTGITQEMIDRGMPLPEAAEAFRRFCGEDYAFLTWGPDDIPMLADNLRVHKLPTDWLSSTYDLQPMFNNVTDGENRQRSLEYAMEYYRIPQNLPAHDALNDAYFTALVASHLDVPRQISEGVGRKNTGEIQLEFGNADIGEVGFPDIPSLLEIPSFTAPLCNRCNTPLSTVDDVLHAKGQRYSRLYTCPEHGSFLYHLHPIRNFDGSYRARMRILRAAEGDVTKYRERLKLAAMRRPAYRRRKKTPQKPQK